MNFINSRGCRKHRGKPIHLNNIVKSILTLYTGGQAPDFGLANGVTPATSEYKDSAPPDSSEKFWLENISKIKVETELGQLPQLWLDPEQIAQALGNLLKNAIEAMPDGGTLTVRTYFTPTITHRNPDGTLPELQGSDNNKGKGNRDTDTPGTVSLEIQDTGHGMSDETMANLFVPYYTTKSETDGTGARHTHRRTDCCRAWC